MRVHPTAESPAKFATPRGKCPDRAVQRRSEMPCRTPPPTCPATRQINGYASVSATPFTSLLYPGITFQGEGRGTLWRISVVHVVQKFVVRAPRKTHTALTTSVRSGQ